MNTVVFLQDAEDNLFVFLQADWKFALFRNLFVSGFIIPAHGAENILSRFGQRSFVCTDQFVTACRKRIIHAAGICENIAVVIVGKFGGDHRASAFTGFHHDERIAEPGDDTVTHRKIFLIGFCTPGIIAEQPAVLRHFFGHRTMHRRVDRVEPVRKHTDGWNVQLRRGAVSDNVNAIGKAAHDKDIFSRQRPHEFFRKHTAVVSGLPRSYDADRSPFVGKNIAFAVEQDRAVVTFFQPFGIIRFVVKYDPDILAQRKTEFFFGPLQQLRVAHRFHDGFIYQRKTEKIFFALPENSGGASEFSYQFPGGYGPDARQHAQSDLKYLFVEIHIQAIISFIYILLHCKRIPKTINRRQKYKSMGLNKFFAGFLLLFLVPLLGSAQQSSVRGTVSDSASGEALVGVVVEASNGAHAVTDIAGSYSIKAGEGELKLTFRYIGYSVKTISVILSPGEEKKLDVKLSDNSKQMKVVVISSGRYEQNIGEVPVSIEVVKPKLIENKNTTNLNAIIDQVPGVNVTDDQANIRGGSGYSYGAGSRVLMVVDDMPMMSGDASDVKWNYLPIENVSQVEVMKGASSALFGSSALNGVIHFRTAYPGEKPQTSITMYTGFYDEPRRPELKWWGNSNPTFNGMNFYHSRQIGSLDLVVGGHLFNDEGYRYLETEQRGRLNVNTRYRFKKIPGLSAGVNTNMMRTTGGLFILWYNDTLAYIPSDSTIQNYRNYRFNIDPFVTYFGAKGHKHSFRSRYYRTDNNNDTQQGATADFYYGEYQYQFKFKNEIVLTSGLVTTYTTVKSDLYKDHTASNAAFYAQVDRKFFKKLFATFGVRGEYYRVDTATTEYALKFSKNDTIATLPFRPVMRAGVTYQLAEATYIRVSYGQGYRFPCVAEKFVRTSASGLEIYPNEQLQPEYGQSAELGVKQGVRIFGWKGYADVAIFWMEYSDMMEFSFGRWGTPSDPFFGLGFRSVNIGSTRTRGVDCSVMGQGKIGPLDFGLLAGYTYMDPISLRWDSTYAANFNTTQENILKYRYRHIAKFDGEIGYKKFSFGMSMRYNSFMENIDKIFEEASIVLPGIKSYRERFHRGDLVYDMRIMYQLNDKARISLVTNNLFNRETTSRPADVQPPRNFALQFVVKF